MATLSQAKTLGGVGSILIFIPFVSLIGYILIVIAIKDISDDLQDKSIFRNVVIAAATGIVGALAGASVFVFGAVTGILTGGVSAFLGIAAGLLVVWVFLIVSAVFLEEGVQLDGKGAWRRHVFHGGDTLPHRRGPDDRARGVHPALRRRNRAGGGVLLDTQPASDTGGGRSRGPTAAAPPRRRPRGAPRSSAPTAARRYRLRPRSATAAARSRRRRAA